MKKNIPVTLLTFLILSCALFAQKLPDFTAPSPTAFELGKFGEIPVGMFTGTANVNIPLHNYKTKNLNVPISLSYSNNGIRVNQLSSWVGLGWNLNVGGVITRTIKGKPDNTGGFGLAQRRFPDAEISEYVTSSATYPNPAILNSFVNLTQNTKDGEHDIYNFNFMGYTGQFVMDSYKRVYPLNNDQALKIISIGFGNTQKFKITTPDGVIYDFSVIEKTRDQSICTYGLPAFHPITAWYLNSIQHPLGDIIEFSYTIQQYGFEKSRQFSYTYFEQLPGPICIDTPAPTLTECSFETLIEGVRLSGIHSNNPENGYLVFNSNLSHPSATSYKLLESIEIFDKFNQEFDAIDFDYYVNNQNRVFLNSINNNDGSKRHFFNYINPHQFPERLSYSIDHWGYFNGKDNNNLLPRPNSIYFQQQWAPLGANRDNDSSFNKIGMLKKIEYPTGGYTLFEYEDNTFYGTKYVYSEPVYNVSTNTEGPQGWGSEINFTTSSYYHFSPNYRTLITASADIDCYEIIDDPTNPNPGNTDDEEGTLELWEINGNDQTYLGGGVVTKGNSWTIPFQLSPNQEYKLKITTDSEECHFIGRISYFEADPISDNYSTGGVRIKRTNNYDLNKPEAEIKRYFYAKKETLNQSSGDRGIAFTDFDYLKIGVHSEQCPPLPNAPPSLLDIYWKTIKISDYNSTFLYNPRGSLTYYPFVTVSVGGDEFEAGGEEHHFISKRLTNNEFIWAGVSPVGGTSTVIALLNQEAANNGLLEKTILFKKNNETIFPVFEKSNTYKEDMLFNKKIPNYISHVLYPWITAPLGMPDYLCKEEDLDKEYEEKVCITSHDHFYRQTDDYLCYAPGNNNSVATRKHPCYLANAQVNDPIPYQTSQFGYFYFDIIKYDHISQRFYLEKTTEKQFDLNGGNPIETTTEYFYDNPKHLQVTRTKTKVNDSDFLIQETYYPDDLASLGGFTTTQANAIQKLQLQGQHQLTRPIQTVSYFNNEVLSTQRTIYKNWGNNDLIAPEIIQASKNNQMLQNIIRYTVTDNVNGNPLELKYENGVPVSYIYGYNHLYPVAKIENKAYSTIPSGLISAIHTASTTGTEAQLQVALNNLRNDNSMKDAMITTYTYKPLVGVTSITGPNGDRTTYHYDAFGRLEAIRDKDGNLMEEYEYNYGNN